METLSVRIKPELRDRIVAAARARDVPVERVVTEALLVALEDMLVVAEEPTQPEICV